MQKALNYSFERRSANFMEWLHDIIKSENYFKADAVVLDNELLLVGE